MMRLDPFLKRAVFLLQPEDRLRILDGGINLESIADDARIG